MDAARLVDSSISLGNAAAQDVLTTYYKQNRFPRLPKPPEFAQISQVGGTASSLSSDGTSVETFANFLRDGGGKRKRNKRSVKTQFSNSSGEVSLPPSRSTSISLSGLRYSTPLR